MNNYLLFRAAAGALFLVDLACYLPWLNTLLGRGYAPPTRWNGPAGISVAATLWIAASLGLILGVQPLACAIVIFLLFRRFYIANRWTSIFRGGGAPGFMSHFVALYLVLFELARACGADSGLQADVLLVYRIDFGLIFLCSGIYKAASGYLQGEGMEYGLANPMWGYWFRLFRGISPSFWFFRFQDIMAALSQIVSGALILYAPTQAWGGLIVIGIFVILLFTVRLGRLSVLMMIVPLLFFPDLGLLPDWATEADRGSLQLAWSGLKPALHLLAVGIAALLPVIKVIQYLNFYGNRNLPAPLQAGFAALTNFIPIIIWRVFTPDVTCFFIRIRERDPLTGGEAVILDEHTGYSYGHWRNLSLKWRFVQVTESIAITSVFTLLKYFRSNRALFEERLLRYARSLPRRPGSLLLFQYVLIVKGERGFDYVPAFNFTVDPSSGVITEERLLADVDYHRGATHSWIREAVGYGTYEIKRS